MRSIITEDETEEFRVNAYNMIYDFKQENRNLKIEEEVTLEEYYRLKKQYDYLSKEYNEICLLEIGKGKYYYKRIHPVMIEQRINGLKSDIFDHYREDINEDKKKEAESLIPVLKEDLQNAKEEEKQLEEYIHKTMDEYNSVRAEYHNKKEKLEEIRKKIKINEKRIEFLERLIRKVDNAYEKSRKINIEKIKSNVKSLKNNDNNNF